MCCCKEKYECEHRFIKKVRTHIFAKAFTARLAGAVASQELHPLRRAQRRGKGKVRSSIHGATSGAEVLS